MLEIIHFKGGWVLLFVVVVGLFFEGWGWGKPHYLVFILCSDSVSLPWLRKVTLILVGIASRVRRVF